MEQRLITYSTAENNKLIAEFMGDDFKTGHGGTIDTLGALKKARPYAWAEYVFFNTSWNWLIPVVEKIESMKGVRVQSSNYWMAWTFAISITTKGYSETHYVSKKEQFIDNIYEFSTRIEATYAAVVHFIKWYMY